MQVLHLKLLSLKNEEMRIFREKCQKVSETSKKNIVSPILTKTLNKNSQLVWSAVGRRDVQELRLGQDPKNFQADHIETISKKSLLCFLPAQGPPGVLGGPCPWCSVALRQVGFKPGWSRKLRHRQCERASIAHPATTVFYSAVIKVPVAPFLDLGNYCWLGILVESESTALLQTETVQEQPWVPSSPGTKLSSL